jgi:plastocyanin
MSTIRPIRSSSDASSTPAEHATARRRGRGPRRHALVAAGPILALLVAACSNAAAGGTGGVYGGTASAAPSASMMVMPPPSGASPAPQGSAEPTSSSGPGQGVAATIAAMNLAFDHTHLDVPAGTPFVLRFDNNDTGIPHNIEILDGSGASVFKGAIVSGPGTVMYQVPALAAGSYTFKCDIHPDMTGTVTAA